MENKVSFTAFLNDEYSKNFDRLAKHTDAAIKGIDKDLNKLSQTGKRAAMSIDQIDKRLEKLGKAKKISIDMRAIEAANHEMKVLQAEKNRLEGGGSPGAGGGGMFGGMGSGFAIAGAAAAIGAAVYDTGAKAVEATAKYQKYEAVLANMLGSQGAAKSKMNEIVDFATKTPFQVDELTSSFVKLKSMGFDPTLKDMTALGDIAASKGKSFEQLSEAVIDAQTFEFERLKEFGIKASQGKGKDSDNVYFLNNGTTTRVKKTSEAIREYILNVGRANGITGAMAAISKTTGGAISNLEDNVDLLYKTIGDRFKPEIDASIGSLSNMITTVKGWFEIPLKEKLEDEIHQLRTLQVELTNSNTTEQRRKEILEQVKKLQPDIVDGTKSEKEQLDNLNKSLESYIGKRKEAIALDIVKSKYARSMSSFEEGKLMIEQGQAKVSAMLADMDQPFATNPNLTFGQKQVEAKKYLNTPSKTSQEALIKAHLKNELQAAIDQTVEGSAMQNAALPDVKKSNIANARLMKILGSSTATVAVKKGGDDKNGGSSSLSNGKTKGSGSSSISNGRPSGGNAAPQNIYVTVDALVKGGVTIQTTTFKEGAQKAVDILKEGFLTVLNDANQMGK